MDSVRDVGVLSLVHPHGRRHSEDHLAEVRWTGHCSNYQASLALRAMASDFTLLLLFPLRVNGKVVGAGNNMHRRYFFDITVSLVVGKVSVTPLP